MGLGNTTKVLVSFIRFSKSRSPYFQRRWQTLKLHIPGNGGTPAPGLVLGIRLLSQVRTLLGLGQVHLGLAELAQVDRSNLLFGNNC